MESISRALVSVALAGLLSGAAAAHVPAAAASNGLTRDAIASSAAHARAANPARTTSGLSPVAIKPVCQDRAFNLTGGHWTQPVHWTFKSSSTPDGLSQAAVELVLVRSFDNITGAQNDCGRADKVGAQNVYDGSSDRSPGVSRLARCGNSDGHNAVGFGGLPKGILAATCTRHVGNRIVEADIRINTRYSWSLSPQSCSNRELLEPTMTHEVGHLYGLGHVSERRHPLMTMSTSSDGPCSNQASTLGLGDMLGLEALY